LDWIGIAFRSSKEKNWDWPSNKIHRIGLASQSNPQWMEIWVLKNDTIHGIANPIQVLDWLQ
jgi:hypothetical protein